MVVFGSAARSDVKGKERRMEGWIYGARMVRWTREFADGAYCLVFWVRMEASWSCRGGAGVIDEDRVSSHVTLVEIPGSGQLRRD